MTDHRMVGSVRTCPLMDKFPLAQSVGPVPRALSHDWTDPTSVVVFVLVPQRRGASARRRGDQYRRRGDQP